MKKFLISRICNSYMSYLAVYSLACFLSGIFLNDPVAVYTAFACTLPLPLIFTYTRFYCKNFILFLVIHAAPAVICLLLPLTFALKLCTALFLVVITLMSVYDRMREENYFEVYHLAYALFIGLLQFGSGFFAMENCVKITLVCEVLYVVLYVTARGFYSLEKFVSDNRDLANFPLKRIKASGIAVNTIFPLGFVLLLAFIPYDKVDRLFRNVTNVLYRVFFFIMRILPFEGNGEVLSRAEEIAFISGNMNKQQEDMTNFMGIPATNGFIKFLGHFGLFCSYIIIAGLVIFLLRLLWKFVYNAYGRYGKGEESTIDIRESLEKVYVKDKKEKKKLSFKERFTAENKIREKFRKRVIKENKGGIVKSKTPKELVSDLTLASDYEIIRYGKEKDNGV